VSAAKAPPAAVLPPVRNRLGYYTLPDGQKCLSVTNIIDNGVPKPQLVHWAAREVAACAIDSLPRLVRVRGADARESEQSWLSRAAERKRDTAANLGGAVHDAVEATILGQPWPDPTEEQAPFLDAFANFVADWAPEFEATELVVAHPEHGWAGKGDAWFRLPRLGPALLIGDWKTRKGIYGEVGLQLSAYQRAKVGWLRDGTEVEPPSATAAYAVHLRPDKYPSSGGYALYPIDTSDAVYASFRAAQAVALDWVKTQAKKVVGEPLANIDTRKGAA
jgi:hypothetical protein